MHDSVLIIHEMRQIELTDVIRERMSSEIEQIIHGDKGRKRAIFAGILNTFLGRVVDFRLVEFCLIGFGR